MKEKGKISKTQAKEKIEKFFENVKDKKSKDVKKIKKLAMSFNIPLKEKRKTFCKKCLMPFSGKEKVRIKSNQKNKIKVIECFCGNLNRWKIN